MYAFQFFGTSESKLGHLLFKNFGDLLEGQVIDIVLTSETSFYSFLNVIME